MGVVVVVVVVRWERGSGGQGSGILVLLWWWWGGCCLRFWRSIFVFCWRDLLLSLLLLLLAGVVRGNDGEEFVNITCFGIRQSQLNDLGST